MEVEGAQQPPLVQTDILKGVIAYVDVRSGEDNRTETFRRLLLSLGATVTRGLNKTVTHVVFRDGPKKTYEKAKRRGVYILSASWVISCLENMARVPEERFPALLSSDYDSPFAKIRMMKSLRPLTSEEYLKRDIANKKRLQSRRERREIRLQYKNTPPALHIPKDYSKYGQIRSCITPLSSKCKPSIESSSEEEYDLDDPDTLPLPLRILKRVPNPNSCVLKFLTTDKQRLVAKLLLEKYGQTTPNNVADMSRSVDEGSLSETVSSTSEEEINISLNVSSTKIEVSETPSKVPEKIVKSVSSCVSQSTPKTSRKRKRTEIKTLEEPARIEPNVTPILNESLEDFKPSKKGVRKRSRLGNLDDVLNSSTPSNSSITKLKGYNETKHVILSSYEIWEKETIVPIIQHLGSYRMEANIGKCTTHVVCGMNRRTFNVLMGIINGCWILKGNWIMDSMEANGWLEEEPYELNEFPGAQVGRKRRMEMGSHYECSLFKSTGPIFLAQNTTLPRQKFSQLLVKAGAKVVSSISKAGIVVGCHVNGSKVKCVSEQWALDCITNYSLLPFNNYELGAS